MNKIYWTTRDGKRIDVDEMDCQHLRNTLKMLLRKQEAKNRRYFFELNGDMAQEFNDIEELDEGWNNGEFYK